jgi:integrase
MFDGMKSNELREDSTIVEWFDTIKPSGNTIKGYLSAMQDYMEFTGKTPEELINEAEQEISAGVIPRKRSIKKYLNDFRKQLYDKELADKTIQKILSAIRSFYASYDIDIPKLSKTEHTVAIKEENIAIPTKSDIQEVLKVCDPLEKALILVGVSSGLSTNEIIRLTVKQFKDGYDPETKITTLSLRRQKVKFDFVTFLSPEASTAVWDYLDYRNRKTKDSRQRRINQLEKQRVFSDSDFLFCRTNISKNFLTTKNEKQRQLTLAIMMKIYRTISEKAGKNTNNGNWNIIRSHNMRRYFNSVLRNNGCDSFHTEHFMGHKLVETQGSYFRPSPEKLREIYLKYVPFLTIQKEEDITVNPIFKKEVSYRQALESELARTSVENSELQDMRKELIEVREFEKIFLNEISELRESFENPKTGADKIMADHRRRMAFDTEYRDEFNRNNITLKPKKKIKEVTNEDYSYSRFG